MKAITIRQPWASLIAAGVKTIETRPRSTSYRGRIAIHAAKAKPPWCPRCNGTSVVAPGSCCPECGGQGIVGLCAEVVALPLGAVVASAVLTDCVPICDAATIADGRHFYVHPNNVALLLWRPGKSGVRMDDQLPYGDFTPGRWALLLDDIKPTTERCPWCWGDGCQPWEALTPEQQAGWGTEPMQDLVSCPVCNGATRCDPVPARGQQAVPWEWEA